MEMHLRIKDLGFRLFLHRQAGLGIDQRTGFRIDDITGLRVDHGLCGLFALGRDFLTFEGFRCRFFSDGLTFFELLQNVSNQRCFCRFFGRSLFCRLFDFFNRFSGLFFRRSFGTVIFFDDLRSFCDQSIFRFVFLIFCFDKFSVLFGFFAFLAFRFDKFSVLFGLFAFFCLFDSLGGLFGLFVFYCFFDSFFSCLFYSFDVHVAFFCLFDRFGDRFFFRAGGRTLDVFCDFRGNGLRLGHDDLFPGFGQVFRKDGIAGCSHDGEHHHEYQDESQYASPACGSIQLSHTAFLSLLEQKKQLTYSLYRRRQGPKSSRSPKTFAGLGRFGRRQKWALHTILNYKGFFFIVQG